MKIGKAPEKGTTFKKCIQKKNSNENDKNKNEKKRYFFMSLF